LEINWPKMEDTVVASAITCLRDFGQQHRDEVFYGFFLDCDAYYFQILGHLNTEDLLRKQATEYHRKHGRDLYQGWSTERLIEHLRWDGGDWGYFEVFEPCRCDGGYKRQIESMTDQFTNEGKGNDSTVYDRFLEMACRVAVRLEREAGFAALRRTSDFRVVCVDHDEKH
jgi:hypothetical protein